MLQLSRIKRALHLYFINRPLDFFTLHLYFITLCLYFKRFSKNPIFALQYTSKNFTTLHIIHFTHASTTLHPYFNYTSYIQILPIWHEKANWGYFSRNNLSIWLEQRGNRETYIVSPSFNPCSITDGVIPQRFACLGGYQGYPPCSVRRVHSGGSESTLLENLYIAWRAKAVVSRVLSDHTFAPHIIKYLLDPQKTDQMYTMRSNYCKKTLHFWQGRT